MGETLNHKLIRQGRVVYASAGGDKLADTLSRFALDLARGKYANPVIIPATIALEGSNWGPADPSIHILYANEKKREGKKSVRLAYIPCQHKDTKELSDIALNHI